MADPNALLRLLAAQQMIGLQNSQTNSGSGSSRINHQTNNIATTQLATAMARFNAINPQTLMWQNMLLAQQQSQALALAQLFQTQQSGSRPSTNSGNPFEEALKKILSNQQAANAKRSHEKSGGSLPKGNTSHSNGSTSSLTKLEPGEVPKKTHHSIKSSTLPNKKMTTVDPNNLAGFSNLLEAFKNAGPSNSMGNIAASSSQPPFTQLLENLKNNGSANPFLANLSNPRASENNNIWQLLSQQMRNQQTQKSTHRTSHPTQRVSKENGYMSQFNLAQKTPEATNSNGIDRDSLTPADDEARQRKHVVTDVEAVRKALEKGWRRQTCIRQLTAAGIRGDVVYYAPCGKKLSTYAEVLRYLQRIGPNEITRDHFSFSCKMLVGEFIWFRTDKNTGENTIVKLSEEEVANELHKLSKPKPPKIIPEKLKKLPKKIKEEEEFFDHGEETLEEIVRDVDEAKGSRIPVDDLFLEEIRPLPTLPRVENLGFKGDGFADALMIHEFLLNFHHVLKIGKESLPSLDELCAGLAGEASLQTMILNLTKTLLTLAFEYPGFPRKDGDPLRQQAGELELSRDNFSELLRMWLQTRDKQGKELSNLLESTVYEELSGEKKSSILAYLCNELLYCRNIIREIDSNLEEIAKLRGERWMREGKVRALRGVHTRKKKKRKQETKTSLIKAENGECDRPESRDSIHSDSSRPTSPAKKTFTPGIGQCEVLTVEEENMEVEELEELIDTLTREADQIRKNVNLMTSRVRTYPLGQDRFHRIYWQLPNINAVLVEGVESAAKNNASVNLQETCQHDPAGITEPEGFIDPDVIACLEDAIDSVIIGGKFDKKRKRRRRLENVAKRGWWTVDQNSLRPLRESLHGRGIRERALHRLLLRDSFVKERQWHTMSMKPIKGSMDQKLLRAEQIYRAERALREIENRVSDASLQVPGWKPPYEPIDEPEDASNDSWTGRAHLLSTIQPPPNLENLRNRLLALEANIERRYLRQNFHAGETISCRKVLGKEESAKEEIENGTTAEEIEVDGHKVTLKINNNHAQEEEDEEEKELCDIWRHAVAVAKTPASIIICAQVLEQSIAWERSAMKAACQVCRNSDNEDQLLLCDLCDLGYHLYCFRPIMDRVPEGEWYCPKCKESASGKPTCLLCSQQRLPIYGCQKCCSFFHTDCAGETAPENPRQYKCATCDNHKKSIRILERDCESRATSETGSDDILNGRKSLKRKTATETLIFPHAMVVDLAKTMLDEIEAQQQAGPFLEPVDENDVPGYRKIIKNPMDMQTMRDKAEAGSYNTPEDFHADVELMFTNCRTFNEDDSPIGQAGMQLHKFFSKRWRQVRYNFCKRLKRMKPSY